MHGFTDGADLSCGLRGTRQDGIILNEGEMVVIKCKIILLTRSCQNKTGFRIEQKWIKRGPKRFKQMNAGRTKGL